jgi:hypothetical protein
MDTSHKIGVFNMKIMMLLALFFLSACAHGTFDLDEDALAHGKGGFAMGLSTPNKMAGEMTLVWVRIDPKTNRLVAREDKNNEDYFSIYLASAMMGDLTENQLRVATVSPGRYAAVVITHNFPGVYRTSAFALDDAYTPTPVDEDRKMVAQVVAGVLGGRTTPINDINNWKIKDFDGLTPAKGALTVEIKPQEIRYFGDWWVLTDGITKCSVGQEEYSALDPRNKDFMARVYGTPEVCPSIEDLKEINKENGQFYLEPLKTRISLEKLKEELVVAPSNGVLLKEQQAQRFVETTSY